MDRRTGKALDGNGHLAQSIHDILTTPIGGRVMRRDYGALIAELLDLPFNGATRLLIFAATALALRAWEPRLRLRKVRLDLPQGGGAGQAVLVLDGERADLPPANARATLSIPLASPLASSGSAPART